MNGKIIIPADVNIWPHELHTAKALANSGYTVKFKKPANGQKVHSADALINGKTWEFKAPNSSKLDAIERNLRRAVKQSGYIVFDSARMKRIPDPAIQREILAKAPFISDINRIIFITRQRKCLDIYRKTK